MDTKALRQKILDLAIHGRLVPQDPNDEPAFELLKRINPGFAPCDNGHYKNLPDGWTICRLEEIIDYEQPTAYIVNSTSYNDSYSIPVLTAGKSFIIGYTNEVQGIYSKLPCIIFDDFTTDSRFVDFPFKVKSSAMKILQVNKEIEIEYVAIFMSITRLIGDTHKRYWISEYSKLAIPIPPRAEQHRIAAEIEKWFALIDQIEQGKASLQTTIKQTKSKILDLAIHGRLVPQDPNDEPASVLLERIRDEKERLIKEGKIKRSKKSATASVENVPFEVPESWMWCRLEDIAYVASGSTPDKSCFVKEGIPYIKMYNLRNQEIDFDYQPQYITEKTHNGKLQRSRTEVGDLIMNIVGPPLGKLAVIPATLPQANFNQAAVLIRPYKCKEVLVRYLQSYLEEMSEINSIATKGSAGQVNISLTQSQNMRIPLPPLPEQHRIAAKIEELFSALDNIQKALEA